MSRSRLTALSGGLVLAACATAPATIAPPAAPDRVVQYVLESTPSGELVSWRADAGAHGTVTPLRTFRGPAGFCREYALTVSTPGGEGARRQEIACRDDQGRWRAAVGAS